MGSKPRGSAPDTEYTPEGSLPDLVSRNRVLSNEVKDAAVLDRRCNRTMSRPPDGGPYFKFDDAISL